MDLLFGLLTTASSQLLENRPIFHKTLCILSPLVYQGVLVHQDQHKADLLAQQFERSHHLTLHLGTPHHSAAITRYVDKFFRTTTPHAAPLNLTNVYEVKRKILSLKLRSAPGEDGITPLMLRNLSFKALFHLIRLFNLLLRSGHFPAS